MLIGNNVMNRRSLFNRLFKVGMLSFLSVSTPVRSIASQSKKDNLTRLDYSRETNQLGYLYLSLYPDELLVCRQFAQKLDRCQLGSKKHDSRVWEMLSQQIRDDFRQGNTVLLSGWVLSRTELRLSTLNIL